MPHHQRHRTPSYNPPRAPPVQAANNAIQTIQRLLKATTKRNAFLAMSNRRLLRENNDLRKLVTQLRSEREQLVQAVTGGEALTSDMFADSCDATDVVCVDRDGTDVRGREEDANEDDDECTMLEEAPVTGV